MGWRRGGFRPTGLFGIVKVKCEVVVVAVVTIVDEEMYYSGWSFLSF